MLSPIGLLQLKQRPKENNPRAYSVVNLVGISITHIAMTYIDALKEFGPEILIDILVVLNEFFLGYYLFSLRFKLRHIALYEKTRNVVLFMVCRPSQMHPGNKWVRDLIENDADIPGYCIFYVQPRAIADMEVKCWRSAKSFV